MVDRRFSSVVCLLSGFFLLFMADASMAEWPEEAPAPYQQSTLESTVEIQSAGHLVLFSPVREIRDEIRSEVMARLPVQGYGQLFEISRDASRQEARAHYFQQLSAGGARFFLSAQVLLVDAAMSGLIRFFGSPVFWGGMPVRIILLQLRQQRTGSSG